MVKVEGFNKEFSAFKDSLPNRVRRNVVDFQLVGSTKHNGEGGDYDVVILVYSRYEMVDELELLGWSNESDCDKTLYPDTFNSMRKGDINLIITQEVEFFERMRNSAEVVRRVQDMFECKLSRPDVCDIYSIILYGKTADE